LVSKNVILGFYQTMQTSDLPADNMQPIYRSSNFVRNQEPPNLRAIFKKVQLDLTNLENNIMHAEYLAINLYGKLNKKDEKAKKREEKAKKIEEIKHEPIKTDPKSQEALNSILFYVTDKKAKVTKAEISLLMDVFLIVKNMKSNWQNRKDFRKMIWKF